MLVTVPRVVALWGVANGVLVVMLIGYGESAFAVSLYASAVALIEVVALAAWLSARALPTSAGRSPAGERSDAAMVTAIGCAFVGVGLVWSRWMMLPALYSLLWLMARWISQLFGRIDEEAEGKADGEHSPEETGSRSPAAEHPVLTTAAVAGTTAITVSAVRRVAQRWRR